MNILLLFFQASTTIMVFMTPILGVIAPFITQFLKKQTKVTGNGALLLTVGISIALAFFGAWVTGALALATTAQIFATIFTVSTLVYKFIIDNDTVQSNLPSALQNTDAPTV